ncbi:Integrator complex subunit 2 [Armadillidium vulgare]|nr:Integrator complex subunit 2 [Armadillidium vulgare]
MGVAAPPVLPHVFKAIEKSDIQRLSLCHENEIRPILPCLVRMSLIAPLDHSEECIMGRKVILCILSGIEAVNALVALLSIDFTALEADVKREQSLRQKMGGNNQCESILVQGLTNGLALEFECSDPTRRLRLLLSELLLVMSQMKELRQDYYMKSSELFDNECYLEEVSDVLCIALAELPSLLLPAEVAETLLHLSNGPSIICKMVANQPDCFREVVMGLIMNGEKQDEESQGGLIRMQAVRLLCQMNPSQALYVRSLCVDQCVMPGLIIYITLDMAKICESSRLPLSGGAMEMTDKLNRHHVPGKEMTVGPTGIPTNVSSEDSDIVSFLTGILLSNDHQQRLWFSQFVKSALRRKFEQPPSALVALRTELIDRLRNLLLFTTTDTLPDSQVIQATTLLRLYCALKSLASLKFSEEREVGLLLQLITCHPPPSAAGVRFVSTGLCVLIACPSLIALPENEKRASEWIKWLVKEEAYFAGASGVSSSSFGAMLLLLAIHFHLQQLSAIIDLVSAALGMKVVITSSARTSNLSRIKYIFTHDVFTEQVVTAHAVKVPVTKDLNANMPGFLPIHCIYHQLKSRMFTKHKVPIKAWIYKQICQCSTPLHPVMPQVIEVYVTSILVPHNRSGVTETFNGPITEDEIMAVFSQSTFTENSFSWQETRIRESPYVQNNLRMKRLRRRCTPIDRQESKSPHQLKRSSRGPSPSNTNASSQKQNIEVSSVMTSQLLLLYYLLLYEDMRLSNMHQIVASNRRVHTYSPYLFAQLPIRYLLTNTQREQKLYAGVFSSLLKLLVTHYPQLCLLDDWMYHPPSANHHLAVLPPKLPLNASSLTKAMEQAANNPGHLIVLLDKMLRLPPNQLWPLAAPFVSSIKCLLEPDVPRKILDTYKLVWLKLNSLFPRRLWAMTVEGLRPDNDHLTNRLPLTEDDIVLDPLYVLRCDQRVFSCSPVLEITKYILQVYLLSSRTLLTQHIQNNPSKPSSIPTNSSSVANNSVLPSNLEEEREKLKSALVLTQESAAIQILLEAAVNMEEKKVGSGFILQEIRSIICSFLHQAFIKDTTLAKLVHFQGYSIELIGPMVEGVPSMHIAVGLSWIPELLQLPDIEKQLFAMELASHLALQNAMPSTLSISRLVINTLSTLLSVLAEEEKIMIMERSLNAIVRIGRAFPPLLDDLVHLLLSFGYFDGPEELCSDSDEKDEKILMCSKGVSKEDELCFKIKNTFRQLVTEAAMSKELF